MAEPQRLQPVRMYEGGDEIDPSQKTIPEPPPKTVQDYYRELRGDVVEVDLSTGQAYEPPEDGEAADVVNAGAEPPADQPPAVAPPKADIRMKVPAPTAAGDLAGAKPKDS